MTDTNHFIVIVVDSLVWPASLTIPSPRFRLLVAADTHRVAVEELSGFAQEALGRGMVYFCAWGNGSERFHDIVDEVRDAGVGQVQLKPPTRNDVVMTTSHENETLQEAIEFFATCAVPTEGYAEGSGYRVVICVNHSDWAETARNYLKSAPFVG